MTTETKPRIKITYATLRNDNEELHALYDAGVEQSRAGLGSEHKNLIDGQWVDGSAGTFEARSPITYIDRVKTPLMLIEGEADYRTPPMSGGEMMFRALKYRHVPTVMVRFPEESHELSRSGKPWHRVERLQHIVGWFDQWLLGKKNPVYERGLRGAGTE